MSLSDMIEQDAEAVFCNPNDFAEPVVYYKENGKGTLEGIRLRSLRGSVSRSNVELLPD